MHRLWFASIVTLGIIFSFVFFIIVLAGLYLGHFSLLPAIALTVGINFLLWLAGPFISDIINRWVYGVKFFREVEFAAAYPSLAVFIQSVCAKHHLKHPKIGIIEDGNPTAYTYGSHKGNARLIMTRGIFNYLNEMEVKAVVAHELGHIVHYDFLVMSIAVTMVQVLYELYYELTVVLGKGKKNSLAGSLSSIGLLSYLFYIIGNYLLLFLSRTREYYADNFAARETGQPHSLSQALVKIAYGILQAQDGKNTKRLLESTRPLGILDVKNAGFINTLVYVSHSPETVAKVMAYDLVSPWAGILELSSTHPLTGKRINALEEIASELGQAKLIDYSKEIALMKIDNARLYRNFARELLIYFLPFILPVPGFIFGGFGGALCGFALGSLVKLNYMMGEGQPAGSSILEAMLNIYASPMKGVRMRLEGRIVGRGVPGYIFSEDLMFEDKTGLLYLNFNSFFGFIGNLLFAVSKVKKLMGESVTAEGWFFRGITQSLTLAGMTHGNEKITSHPKVWGNFVYTGILFFGILIIAVVHL